MRALVFSLVVLLSAPFATPTATAQTQSKPALTVEWIFGDEGRQVASLPLYFWTSDNSLLMYDGRRPPSQRAFELLDPSTGARRVAFDMAAAVASLNAL